MLPLLLPLFAVHAALTSPEAPAITVEPAAAAPVVALVQTTPVLLAAPAPWQGDDEYPRTRWRSPDQELELALSNEAFWLSYRLPRDAGDGYFGAGFLFNEDTDYLATLRVMRTGSHHGDHLTLGVGVAGYGAALDKPDANVFAIALAGSASYAFRTKYPTSFGVEVAFAPDITTFDDGDQLVDAIARFEVGISDNSTVFVGYHILEVGLDKAPDHDVDRSVQVGFRIAF
jgi:hypothetical protein